MAKDEKPGHRTSADFAGSDHLDRHPREVHGQPWEAGNWHIGRRQELAVDVRPTLLAVEQYAEYLQSEAKEINRRVGLKAYGARTAGAITLKSLNSDAVAQPNFASSVTSSGSATKPCLFWKTYQGGVQSSARHGMHLFWQISERLRDPFRIT